MDRPCRILFWFLLSIGIVGMSSIGSVGLMMFTLGAAPAKEPAKEPNKQGEGFFEILKVGDQVGIKEIAGKYKIMLDNRPAGSKVVDIGRDFIAVEDPGGTTTRIPVTSVLCISDMRKLLDK